MISDCKRREITDFVEIICMHYKRMLTTFTFFIFFLRSDSLHIVSNLCCSLYMETSRKISVPYSANLV